MDDREKAAIFEEGRKVGEEYERAKWYYAARNIPALIAMGWGSSRPKRPRNPYKGVE